MENFLRKGEEKVHLTAVIRPSGLDVTVVYAVDF